jgi:MOSC domain-containing protein YiiM
VVEVVVRHRSIEELERGVEAVRQSPRDEGVLELIVRRPRTNEREVLEVGELDLVDGLVGDKWKRGSADPEAQLTVINTRAIALLAQQKDRWPLAGDQLFVSLDLSEANVPAGTRLAVGAAVIEVTSTPHTGCRAFADRYGIDAVKFVNSPLGRALHLRGINTRVAQPGAIRIGDRVRKISR